MVSGIFSFDNKKIDFDQKMMKLMPILPIYSSTFGQMSKGHGHIWASMGLPPTSSIVISRNIITIIYL